MKNFKSVFSLLAAAILLCTAPKTYAQAIGNYDYRELGNVHYVHPAVQAAQSALTYLRPPKNLEIKVRGLSNCEADSYLAIFSITQVGKTQREADVLLRSRIDSVKVALKRRGAAAELFIDMISFQPIYELEQSKKLFSKATYNEIPKGFELKKNLHFRYSDPKVLDELVTFCAEQDIYDLVRVDYFIDDIEKKKQEIITRAEAYLESKLARFNRQMKLDLTEMQRQFADGFAMYYPVEQYRTYQTYHSNAFNKPDAADTKVAQATTSQFFMPRVSKDYDFVINNSMLEPVIQIEYEVVLVLTPKPAEPAPAPPAPKEVIRTEREYYLITPNAEVKRLGM
jgi:hypothetical protein